MNTFKVNKLELIDAIKDLTKVGGKPEPSMLIEFESNYMGLTINTGAIQVFRRIKIDSSETASALVASGDFGRFVQSLAKVKGDEITLNFEHASMDVSVGKNKCAFPLLDVNSFVSFDMVDADNARVFKLKAPEFQKALKKGSLAFGKDESKPNTLYAFLIFGESSMDVVSSDHYRVSWYSLDKEHIEGLGESCVVPIRGAFLANLDFNEGTMAISTDSKVIKVFNRVKSVSFKVDDVTPVDYRSVFSTEEKAAEEGTSFTIEKASFIDTMSVVEVIGELPVALNVDSDNSELKVYRLDGASAAIPIKEIHSFNEESALRAFNPFYLKVIKEIQSFDFKVTFAPKITKAFIGSQDEPEFKYLVLPIRINDKIEKVEEDKDEE